jgi:hypothetical protein
MMDNPLMIADILIWESTNALLLIPVVIALVMLVRWIRGRPVFSERDWLFLFGHARVKVLSLHMWLRFVVLWAAVVLIGFVEGYVLLPFGLAAFLGAVFLTAFVVWRVAPKLLGWWKPGEPKRERVTRYFFRASSNCRHPHPYLRQN